jgi:threonine dehydratase
MDPPDLSRGLVSLSAGNHAAALAYGATALGAKATIVMPAAAMQSKVEATRRYGGDVVQTEGSLLDACLALQRERNLTLVHPFDDLSIMAGQGTVGLELLEQVPTVDIVVVPVGGGGLISGIAAAVKPHHPSVGVVGVEPEGADAMNRSLEQGVPVHLEKVDTIADGLAPPFAGEHTFRHVQRFVDEMVRVTDGEILDGLRVLIQRCKLAAEPSGAAGLAALLSSKGGVSSSGLNSGVRDQRGERRAGPPEEAPVSRSPLSDTGSIRQHARNGLTSPPVRPNVLSDQRACADYHLDVFRRRQGDSPD